MTTQEPIPFLDLVALHRDIEDELLDVARTAIRSGAFIGGSMVQEFETAFATFCETRYCVGVSSGTDALRFALIAAGVGAEDSVITVPNSFIATTEAITQAGAVPEFVDIDERTYTIDCDKLEAFLKARCRRDAGGTLRSERTGRRVAAIIPVHLYGHMADMHRVLLLAERYGLIVIEDACQAHGSEYNAQKLRWCKAGSMSMASAFSFYPGKNLGACGEAGAVVSDDENVARKIRMLRDHGQAEKYYHEIEGYNGRLDAMQAGFLRVKLAHLHTWINERRAAAGRYRDLFLRAGLPLELPEEAPWARAVYHLYVIRSAERDLLRDHLARTGIGTGIHYPIPLHLQQAYRYLGYRKGDFPVCEAVANSILSLPMFPSILPEQQNRVVEAITQFVSSKSAAAA